MVEGSIIHCIYVNQKRIKLNISKKKNRKRQRNKTTRKERKTLKTVNEGNQKEENNSGTTILVFQPLGTWQPDTYHHRDNMKMMDG